MFKQESYKIEKRKKKRENKLQKRQKEAFNLVSVCVKTGRNSQTKGKKNNFCIVYFEEVVVANILAYMVVTLDVTHVERSPLKAGALKNTDSRSMDTIGTIPQLDECSNKNRTKLKRGRRKERTNYKIDTKKHSILLVCV